MPEPKPQPSAEEGDDPDMAMDSEIDPPQIPDNMSESDLDMVVSCLQEIGKVIIGAEHLIVSLILVVDDSSSSYLTGFL